MLKYPKSCIRRIDHITFANFGKSTIASITRNQNYYSSFFHYQHKLPNISSYTLANMSNNNTPAKRKMSLTLQNSKRMNLATGGTSGSISSDDISSNTRSNGSMIIDNGSDMESDIESEISSISQTEAQTIITKESDNPAWQRTITDVVKSVVSIHFTQIANFDSDESIVSEATGFVVDADIGLILTNRHVVCAGPFWGYAIFDNHEEVPVKPIYRDPVHDFGFLKFDPEDVKYLKLQALELKPELAKIGCEIRVVGNDAGEKLSILAGFISRIDRNAPDYGALTYNDFNTEYIQAAASASGGSSGSPVVNIDGYAIALQAGGSDSASTDFFLPVYRALRALKCIQNNDTITRGTIQVQWILRPFDECRRLGLTPKAEERAREIFPSAIGLLVAEVILPEGPADGKIKEGDTLISINGIDISTFVKVDEIFDENVGNVLNIVVERGGENIVVECQVGDLHAITPNRYLEVCGASFNEMSYQMARIYAIPVRGVFVNNASGSFSFDSEKCGWIIDSIDDQDTPNLDTFIEVMKSIPDGARIPVTYRHLSDLHSPNVSVIHIDRHWQSTFKIALRNDETGLWDFSVIQDKPLSLPPLQPHNAKFVDIPIQEKGCSKLVKSLVLVTTSLPIPLDSFPHSKLRVYGLIIDAKNGYVVVSRYVVPHDLCDVHITIAQSINVPAKVVFLHPVQNYAIVKYDPSLVLAPVETPKISETPLKRGDKVMFIGYNFSLRVLTSETKVSDISSISIPVNSMTPRYRGTNLEAIHVDTNLASHCDSGVLADSDGSIRALWLSYLGEKVGETDVVYRMGLDITEVNGIIKQLQLGETPKLRIVDAEFCALAIVQSRIRGVPEEWISKIESISDDEPQFLVVSRVSVPAPAQPKNPLLPGDIILSVDEKPVNRIRDLQKLYQKENLNFKIVRRKKEMELEIETVPTDTYNTSQLVFWCGAVLQAPHHGVRQIMKNLPSGVYCTNRAHGSPARHYGISSSNFITHVDGIPTPDLDSFVRVARNIPDNTYCKLRLVTFDNIPFAMSIKTNYYYFPTAELKKDPIQDKWKSSELGEK